MNGDKKLEEAAAAILKRAVVLDQNNRYTEALICYQEGLQLLMDIMKGIPAGVKKNTIKQKIEDYIGRAEKIKKIVEDKKASGTYHECIVIENDSKGHGYESLMGRFLDTDVTCVKVEDPYLRNFNQFCNFVQFCELIVKKCKNLKIIAVLTGPDIENLSSQQGWFNSLQKDLQKNHNIELNVNFSTTLHDRQILLNNGWIIKIGRGLDYFRPPNVKHGLGSFDMDLRFCRETTVDIFHKSE